MSSCASSNNFNMGWVLFPECPDFNPKPPGWAEIRSIRDYCSGNMSNSQHIDATSPSRAPRVSPSPRYTSTLPCPLSLTPSLSPTLSLCSWPWRSSHPSFTIEAPTLPELHRRIAGARRQRAAPPRLHLLPWS